jgi:cellulose synthase/poly-beta-1,6-N-acetylglucosamine synthase-like glycosyltransferase
MNQMIDTLALIAVALLLCVWVVYPLTIAFVASVLRRRAGAEDQPSLARVSVVIATREEDAVVIERLGNCLETDYPLDRIEVVVARDAAHAGSPLANENTARVVCVSADPPGGKAATLNAGVRAAGGEVVVFADSHQQYRRDTIPELVRALARDRVGAVSGRLEIRSTSLAAVYWRYERWLRRIEAQVHSSIGATGAVYAIRRSLWQPLPAGLLLDDVYTPMRIVLAGWRVAFSDTAVAIETRQPSAKQEYVRKVRTLTGVLQLCSWLPAVLVPVRNPVWIQFVFHKLLRMLTPYASAFIMLWALVKAVQLAGSAAPGIALGLLVFVLWAATTHGKWAIRFRRLATEAALLHWAVVTAGINGLRGRWGVWDA